MKRANTAIRSARNKIKRYEMVLYFVTATFGVYLAGGSIVRAASSHDRAWDPGKPLFVALVVCAVWVPLYALYKAIDSHFETEDRQQTQASRDLSLACQKVVSQIADACPTVGVNDLTACIWMCRTDGSFDEVARFYLPHHRKGSGVTWCKGKGVAGTAWESDDDLCSDLTILVARLDTMDAEDFDKLPSTERFGLSASDLGKTRAYTGVCAIRLFSTAREPKLVAMFVLEYTGRYGFDCVGAQVVLRSVSTLLAGCEQVLTEAGSAL